MHNRSQRARIMKDSSPRARRQRALHQAMTSSAAAPKGAKLSRTASNKQQAWEDQTPCQRVRELCTTLDNDMMQHSDFKDIEDISSRLEEAGSNTATQVELNKKREGELARLKAELEELNISQEGTLAALRMKHNNTMSHLGEQIDQLNSNKVKSEKDKSGLELDLRDARLDLEDAVKVKAELDKQGKLLQAAIVDANTRLD